MKRLDSGLESHRKEVTLERVLLKKETKLSKLNFPVS